MAKDMNPFAGAISPKGAANAVGGVTVGADPGDVPPPSAYRLTDGQVLNLPFDQLRVGGSAPMMDCRDPKGPKPS